MPTATILTNDNLETFATHLRVVKTKLTFTTAATAASIVVSSDNPGIQCYYTAGSATPTAPTGATFGSLTNTSGSVVGVYIVDGAAATYEGALFSFTSDLTPSITAVIPVKCGTSSSGITSGNTGNLTSGAVTQSLNGNVALTLGLTGLTLLATATTQNLWCEFSYKIALGS